MGSKTIIMFSLLWIIVIILGFFTFYNYTHLGEIPKKDAETGTGGDSHLTILIGVAGFLAAFSAISIYSIFNANVERERSEIRKLKKELDERYSTLDNFDRNIEVRIELLHSLFQLTSPFIDSGKKRAVIKEFRKDKKLDENSKEIMYEYFLSVKDDENVVGQKYFEELENLLKKLEMIPKKQESKWKKMWAKLLKKKSTPDETQ